MIASKLAAMVPERVLSLALLNVTGGGFECFPKVCNVLLLLLVFFFSLCLLSLNDTSLYKVAIGFTSVGFLMFTLTTFMTD